MLFALLFLWSGSALAQEIASGIVEKGMQKVEVKIDKSKVSPEFRRILEVEETATNEISQLNQKIKKADGDLAAELQKEVEKIKRNAKIEILKIRLEIAQERNDTRNIYQIEKALDQPENPPVIVEDQKSKAEREAWEKGNRDK